MFTGRQRLQRAARMIRKIRRDQDGVHVHRQKGVFAFRDGRLRTDFLEVRPHERTDVAARHDVYA